MTMEDAATKYDAAIDLDEEHKMWVFSFGDLS